MGRPSKSSVQHFKTREDGKKGCWVCGNVAVRWMDWRHNGIDKFVRTAYCDAHGDEDLQDPQVTERKIRG